MNLIKLYTILAYHVFHHLVWLMVILSVSNDYANALFIYVYLVCIYSRKWYIGSRMCSTFSRNQIRDFDHISFTFEFQIYVSTTGVHWTCIRNHLNRRCHNYCIVHSNLKLSPHNDGRYSYCLIWNLKEFVATMVLVIWYVKFLKLGSMDSY